jgi:hypothetical protein
MWGEQGVHSIYTEVDQLVSLHTILEHSLAALASCAGIISWQRLSVGDVDAPAHKVHFATGTCYKGYSPCSEEQLQLHFVTTMATSTSYLHLL